MYTITYRHKESGLTNTFTTEAYSKTDAENKFRLNHGRDFEIISIE